MKFMRAFSSIIAFFVISLIGVLISNIVFPSDDTPLWFVLLTFVIAGCVSALLFMRSTRKARSNSTPTNGRHVSVPSQDRRRPAPERATRPSPPSPPSIDSYLKEERDIQRSAIQTRESKRFSDVLSSIPRAEIAISAQKAKRNMVSDMPDIKFTNITRRTVIEKLFPLVAIDTETTGLTPRGNDIIEVSAIKFDVGFHPVSCYTTLLKSRSPIPAAATEINHITDSMVSDRPFFADIAQSFSSYISGCNIVGHNLPFDLKFLYVCGAALPEKVRYYDTYRLAKLTLTSQGSTEWDNDIGARVDVYDYDVEDYKLDTLCEYYGIYRDTSHRSLSDCLATAMLFERLIEDKTS